MNPIDRLKDILADDGKPPLSFVGTVIEVEVEAVTVQSPHGRTRAVRPSYLILSVGDEVLISNGAVQGRVKRAADVAVYRL